MWTTSVRDLLPLNSSQFYIYREANLQLLRSMKVQNTEATTPARRFRQDAVLDTKIAGELLKL